MEYWDLVEVYLALEKTSKRLEKTHLVAELLKRVGADELAVIVYVLHGRVFPDTDEQKIGFSSRLMLKAIETATGTSSKEVEARWSRVGDLGIVAEELLQKRTQMTLSRRTLTVAKVVQNVQKLASVEGEGSVNRKIGLVSELLTSASPVEARFVVRTVLETLRVGIAAGIVRDAIAEAFQQDVVGVEEAFNVTGDYGEVAVLARKGALATAVFELGKPMKSMLAVLVSSVEEAFEGVGAPAQFEYKLDGFRLQMHKDGDKVVLFTRRLENVTKQFPDVVAAVRSCVAAKRVVLDAEAVGYDRKTHHYLPFQSISQRIKRKYAIEGMAKQFPVEVHVFDVLYHEGESVLKLPLRERRKIMTRVVKKKAWVMTPTEALVTADGKEARAFFDAAVEAGHEGVMVKSLASPYRAGRYVGGWVKLKSVLEPLDLVVVGAEWGEGKRATWLTSYIVACRAGKEFVEVGRVSTGLKEKEGEEGVTFEEMTRLLKPLVIGRKGRVVRVKPKVMIEVAYEEVQASPTYTSGFALRFPRVRQVRVDKPLSEVSTRALVEKIYYSQQGKNRE